MFCQLLSQSISGVIDQMGKSYFGLFTSACLLTMGSRFDSQLGRSEKIN